MQIFSFLSIVTFLFFFHSKAPVVGADKVVLFAFNNGVSPSATTTCNHEDNLKINLVFFRAPLARARRQLRSGSVDVIANVFSDLSYSDNLKNTSSVSRLASVTSRCKNACGSYEPGTCRAIGCKGFRRELNDELTDYDDRKLQTDKCDASIAYINTELNKLISTNAISTSCQSFLAASKRNSTCYDDTIYGKIESIKFWNVAVPSSPRLMATFSADSIPFSIPPMPSWTSGFSFCKSEKITVEAVANECVEVVQFHLYKVNEKWNLLQKSDRFSRPFSLYNIDANQQMIGSNLPAGVYVIDSKPDWFNSREKRFMFTVLNC